MACDHKHSGGGDEQQKENFVFISPHSPLQMAFFARALAESRRFRVLAIADAAWEELPHELHTTCEYYRVSSLENYAEVYRGIAWFAHKFGKPARIESFNEHWLTLEARLREDFNVRTGWTVAQITELRRKSAMKALFEKAGVAVARWCVPRSLDDLLRFAASLLPSLSSSKFINVFVKPDQGVGAQGTRKITSEADIRRFWEDQRQLIEAGMFIAEEYLPGPIITYDGLVADDGRVVFASSLEYEASPFDVLSAAANGTPKRFAYWTHPAPARDVTEIGPAVVNAFGLRRQFFHIEFIRQPTTGKLFALEINLRPPGSPTPDMWNFSCDCDIYATYAKVIAGEPVAPIAPGKFRTVFVGRFPNVRYARSREDLVARFGPKLVAEYRLAPAYAVLMGENVFLVRVREVNEIEVVIGVIAEEWKDPAPLSQPKRSKSPMLPFASPESTSRQVQQQVQLPVPQVQQSQGSPRRVFAPIRAS
jgi:hypothetical protein